MPLSIIADPQSSDPDILHILPSSLFFFKQCYHELPVPISLLRVKNWRIPEAELLHRLRSLHQQAQQSSSSSSGEQEQEQAEAELTRKGRPKNKKEALFTRIGFKSTTMEQIQAIFFFV